MLQIEPQIIDEAQVNHKSFTRPRGTRLGMLKRLTAANLGAGIASSIRAVNLKRKWKRKQWERHENRPLSQPYTRQMNKRVCSFLFWQWPQ